MFAESGPSSVTRHRHPVWKVVLPLEGLVVWDDGTRTCSAPGLLVPPQTVHACAVTAGYVALFLAPWMLPRARGPVPLDTSPVRRILTALGSQEPTEIGRQPKLAAASRALLSCTGRPQALDPRVADAARAMFHHRSPTTLADLAAELGLSPSRLRTLVRDCLGVPLTALRQWARLHRVVADLPDTPIASAAIGNGFADQAHLTRTSRRMLGRTPSSLRGRQREPSRLAVRR